MSEPLGIGGTASPRRIVSRSSETALLHPKQAVPDESRKRARTMGLGTRSRRAREPSAGGVP
jgi:hypothetical protein